jgi:hypothetical protein
MVIPQDELAYATEVLEEFCEERTPVMVRDKVVLQFRVEGQAIVLYEKRPFFRDPRKWIDNEVAKFRYWKERDEWSLYWQDRNCKWHLFEPLESAKELQVLVDEVGRDRTSIFFG